jgi:prophage regulatory protein
MKIITRRELTKIVPYSITHIGRLESKGEFPRRISFGLNRVGWDAEEIFSWIEERKQMREQLVASR